jgi:hypothetical protein
MKTLHSMLALALAINISLLVPQLMANEQEARADFQKHLATAKELLDEGQWPALAAEARDLGDDSKSFARGSTIESHATKLVDAARAEDRAAATLHYNAIAASFHANADRSEDRADADADNTKRNVRERNGHTLTPVDQGNNKADVNTTAQIRKEIIANKNMSVSARNVKIITNGGKVTLRGPVDSAREKELIEEIAQRIARSDVDNQIEVKLRTSSNN